MSKNLATDTSLEINGKFRYVPEIHGKEIDLIGEAHQLKTQNKVLQYIVLTFRSLERTVADLRLELGRVERERDEAIKQRDLVLQTVKNLMLAEKEAAKRKDELIDIWGKFGK